MSSKQDGVGEPNLLSPSGEYAVVCEREETPVAARLLRAILQASSEEIATLDRDGRFLFVNSAFARAVGWKPEEVVGKTGQEIGAPAELVAQFDRERECVLASGEPLTGKVVYPTPQGARHYDYLWTPLPDETGATTALLFAARDVTVRRREELAQAFLTRASEVFASSLDYERTLQQVADLAVPHIADWCGVDMREEDGAISQVAVAHIDPEKIRWAHELRRLYPPDPQGTSGLPGVLRTGKSELYAHIPDEMMVAFARDERHLEMTRHIGMRSVMIVPIVGRERVLGAITFVTTHESGHTLTQAEVALAEGLAARAALAIENARLYRMAQDELAERRRAQEALEASERRFRFALADSGAIVYTQDRELRYTWVYDGGLNEENRAVYGLTDSDLLPAEEADVLIEIKRRVLQTGIEERHIIQVTVPGTATRSLDTLFAPVYAADGTVIGLTGIANDITPLKQTQDALVEHQAVIESLNARLQRAMRETHHRVKNNLQMIAAMIDMQEMEHTESVSISELTRLRRHIQALSALHDLLTQQARTDMDVFDLSVLEAMESLIPTLQSLAADRNIAFAVEDLRMPVRHVTALILLINELVSNAIKHGQGEIEVIFAPRAGSIALEVRDRGPGFPVDFNATTAAHTGLELVKTLTRLDLRGEIRFENREERGGRVIVAFPLPLGQRTSGEE